MTERASRSCLFLVAVQPPEPVPDIDDLRSISLRLTVFRSEDSSSTFVLKGVLAPFVSVPKVFLDGRAAGDPEPTNALSPQLAAAR